MEIDAVIDRESLKDYLEALPDAHRTLIARRIAFLTAARIAPIGLRYFADRAVHQKRDLTGLPMLMALSYSRVASNSPTPEYAAADATDAAAKAANATHAAADATHAAAKAADAAADAADAAHAASFAASYAGSYAAEVWRWVQSDLTRSAADPFQPMPPLWEGLVQPPEIAQAWAECKKQLTADAKADWTFWITWYERVLAGQDLHAEALAKVLDTLTQEEIEGDPAKVLPRFDPILALYQGDSGSGSAGLPVEHRVTRHFKTIRAQTETFKAFLEIEYEELRGQNARSPEQDSLKDLLEELKTVIDQMIADLTDGTDEAQAIAVVQENLPAVFEKAGEIAVIEDELKVSPSVAAMAINIKHLIEAGVKPKLATKIAISAEAGNKLGPWFRRIFKKKGSDGNG